MSFEQSVKLGKRFRYSRLARPLDYLLISKQINIVNSVAEPDSTFEKGILCLHRL